MPPPREILANDRAFSDATLGASLPFAGAQAQVPTSISGRFRILTELGAGAMGRVYRALDLELEEEVALKVLRSPASGLSRDVHDQLRREVKATRRIHSPHVVRIYECGVDHEFAWFSMEMLDGCALSATLQRQGRLSLGEIVHVGHSVCLGLEAAHAAGVVHRDLKPANVLVSGARIAICDFGLAHVDWHQNQSRSIVGTPTYFAPEQMTGDRVTPATDLFALGVMLYELATGRPPWVGDSIMALAMARLHDAVVDPRQYARDLPDGLVQLILRCLQVLPERRPGSAREVADALTALGRGTRTRPISSPTTALPTSAEPSSLLRAQVPRVVVLPFESVGLPSALSAGLAEDITAALLPHRRLRTVASRVARRLADVGEEPAAIGRQLGVDYVVDGSVRQVGNLWRVHVTLTSCADDAVCWSQTVQCDEARGHHVHDELATAIAQHLLGEAPPVSTVPSVTDPEVMRAYVAGRRRYNEAMATFDSVALREAELHFAHAAELAPSEPLVAAGLAMAVSGQLTVEAVIAPGALEEAERLATRAVNLAPQSGEAWLAQGVAQLHAGQPVDAAWSLRRAVGLAPSLPEPRALLAALLVDAGWLTHGRHQLEAALALGGDPAAILGELGRVAVLTGDVAWRAKLRAQVTARGLSPFLWWRGVYAGALAINDHTLVRDTYREMSQPQWAPLPPFVEALRIVLGAVSGETDGAAHDALLPTVGWGQGSTPLRRCRTLVLLMSRWRDHMPADIVLEKLREAVDCGLANRAWLEQSDALTAVRGLPECAVLHQRVIERTAAVVDAYCGEWESQSGTSQPAPSCPTA